MCVFTSHGNHRRELRYTFLFPFFIFTFLFSVTLYCCLLYCLLFHLVFIYSIYSESYKTMFYIEYMGKDLVESSKACRDHLLLFHLNFHFSHFFPVYLIHEIKSHSDKTYHSSITLTVHVFIDCH